MAFMIDNASNNNTLVQGIVALAAAQHIYLDAKQIRLRCMPHTIHLAALKVSDTASYHISLDLCNHLAP